MHYAANIVRILFLVRFFTCWWLCATRGGVYEKPGLGAVIHGLKHKDHLRLLSIFTPQAERAGWARSGFRSLGNCRLTHNQHSTLLSYCPKIISGSKGTVESMTLCGHVSPQAENRKKLDVYEIYPRLVDVIFNYQKDIFCFVKLTWSYLNL